MSVWLRRRADGGASLFLHVQPGAKKTEVVGEHGDALKIRLAAPPVDGKANAALLAFLADRTGVARADLRLAAGQTGRRKVVDVSHAPADLGERLMPRSQTVP